MLKRLTNAFAIGAAAVALTAAPAASIAQSQGQGGDEQARPGQTTGHMHGSQHMKGSSDSGSMMSCEQMQAKMQKMHAEAEQMQSQLDDLVKQMNSTTGKAQQEAIARLLTELVEQRGAMHGMMSNMQPMMMQHMMGHMQSMHSGQAAHKGAMMGMPCCARSDSDDDTTARSSESPQGSGESAQQ